MAGWCVLGVSQLPPWVDEDNPVDRALGTGVGLGTMGMERKTRSILTRIAYTPSLNPYAYSISSASFTKSESSAFQASH